MKGCFSASFFCCVILKLYSYFYGYFTGSIKTQYKYNLLGIYYCNY